MGDQLQPIIQTAVRLDVQVDGIAVCDLQQPVGVRAGFTAFVDLQLYTELAQPFAVKDQVRRIVIFMDRAFCADVIIAVAAKIVVIAVVDVLISDQDAAPVTVSAAFLASSPNISKKSPI